MHFRILLPALKSSDLYLHHSHTWYAFTPDVHEERIHAFSPRAQSVSRTMRYEFLPEVWEWTSVSQEVDTKLSDSCKVQLQYSALTGHQWLAASVRYVSHGSNTRHPPADFCM